MLLRNSNWKFYFLVFSTFVVILFSHPFLRYPYDMWEHLIRIEENYGDSRALWYQSWHLLFQLFSINDVFLKAKIIHVLQTCISLASVYYFSHVLIRNLFKKTDSLVLHYMAFWSAIIWLTIYATFSVHYHQVWIMWYSVNYQISLAFFWYITGLTIVLLFEKNTVISKLLIISQIILFSFIILSIHPMEIAYYGMYLFLFTLVFIDKIFSAVRKGYYIFFPAILVVVLILYVFFTESYHDKVPTFIKILHNGSLDILYDTVLHEGQILVDGANRASAAINELMFVELFFGLMILIDIAQRKIKGQVISVNMRLTVLLALSSLFILIPLYQLSAGIASILFKINVVNRIYYSSSLFILIPVALYYFRNIFYKHINPLRLNLSVLLILGATLLWSFSFSDSHNYYKNLKSITDSFNESKVGFHLTKKNISRIGHMLNTYESAQTNSNKPVKYFARADIAYVIKYIYKRDVFWVGRRMNPDHKYNYGLYIKKEKNSKTKKAILFETPDEFPEYKLYK